MGRELRMVPANWQHPKNDRGHFIPLLNGCGAEAVADWREGADKWELGFRSDYEGGWLPIEEKYRGLTYSEWAGDEPDPAGYMPDWPASERTHFMMYEDTSEGTPISPGFAKAEHLARWLADNEASAFAGMSATYDQWLATINRGRAISAVVTDGVMQSGVAFGA